MFLAEKRLEKAIHAIEILKPLSDKSRYEYSEKQANYIVKKLKTAVNELDLSFKGEKTNQKKVSLPKE
ncbi:MAG: hypothetical protein M1344_03410 [Candidatus Thermoplasmatota archaeon]|nr:hypothetical protein [Candidatus Thermoplasmatota archaeon]